MGIPCGELLLTVSETSIYRGRPVYIVHAHASTNRAFSVFYSVSDTLTSYIDVEGLFSWKYEKEIKESKSDTIDVCEYDQPQGAWTRNGHAGGQVLPFTQDLLSAFYYLRAMDWSGAGDTIQIPINDTKKNYQIHFGLGEQRRLYSQAHRAWLSVRSGTPILELEDKFQQIGNNEVWFTDDPSRVPVLIRSHILLGTFYAKLVEYDPGVRP